MFIGPLTMESCLGSHYAHIPKSNVIVVYYKIIYIQRLNNALYVLQEYKEEKNI